MNRDLYALHDTEPTIAFKVSEESAHEWNRKGYGIFWTVNEFSGRRKGSNLKRLNSWYVEIDELDKAQQLALMEASPVPPNLIVESKRGFQAYWNCRDATIDSYTTILQSLQLFFTGDPRAKDIARLLRAPGYNHMKDPDVPFPVSVVWNLEGTYSERLMLYNFPPQIEQKVTQPQARKIVMQTTGDGFWDRVYNLDCEEALMRLSGSHYVNGEVYSFRSVSGGRKNILVNGKSTSSWIDSNKRIGSTAGGGPTVFQWLKYFGLSNKESYQIVKEVFPEVMK